MRTAPMLLGLPLLLAACASSPAPRAAPAPAPAITVASVASAAPVVASTAPVGRHARIDLDVQDMDLAQVMELIGRQVGTNILVDPAVHERVTITLRDVPWREAVDIIARLTRCEVEERSF